MAWSLQVAPEFSDKQFKQWSKLLEERTGVQMAPQHRAFLQSQISTRMREMGYSDYNQYFEQVAEGVTGRVEWSRLVDRLVVKETSFFRHRPSIEQAGQFLRTYISEQRLTNGFDIWSVGCATGEEPYSLAMEINSCFERAAIKPCYGITATDISVPAINFARKGIYPARKLEQVDPVEREKYFKLVDKGHYLINEVLRDRICFSQGNVLNINEMPLVKMNIIFCQNLLIYFRRWRRREILNAFIERLKSGGLLIIGIGEVVEWEHRDVQRVVDDRIQAYIRC